MRTNKRTGQTQGRWGWASDSDVNGKFSFKVDEDGSVTNTLLGVRLNERSLGDVEQNNHLEVCTVWIANSAEQEE